MTGENLPVWYDYPPRSGPPIIFQGDPRVQEPDEILLAAPIVTRDPEWGKWLKEACGRNRETGIWPMALFKLDTNPGKTAPAIHITHETPLTAYIRALGRKVSSGVIGPTQYARVVNAILEGEITEKDIHPPEA